MAMRRDHADDLLMHTDDLCELELQADDERRFFALQIEPQASDLQKNTLLLQLRF